MNDTITEIRARQVLDSRGSPTIEVEVFCRGGAKGRAIVPSGASTGKHEAKELRDEDPAHFAGKGVLQAVANVHETIAPRLVGMAADDQTRIDKLLCELDGTPDKSRLGANAILGVSLACAHAAAAARTVPLWRYLTGGTLAGGTDVSFVNDRRDASPTLPMPMVNLISGGLHAGGNLDFQDFLLLPIGARSFSEALEMTVSVYRTLGDILKHLCFEGVLVGDEGGFGPRLHSNEQAVEMIVAAIERAGLSPGRDAAIALDSASTHFFRKGQYHLAKKKSLTTPEMIALLKQWVADYPILSIEDGLAEDDWDGWKQLTRALGDRIQLIGDDLFATNTERLRRGIAEKAANSILVKPNQIGTLTETLTVIAQARAAGYRPVISARSGETEDTTIADLAVATGAGQIKIGSVARSERLAKYNQLLRIEEELGANAPFAGWRNVERQERR